MGRSRFRMSSWLLPLALLGAGCGGAPLEGESPEEPLYDEPLYEVSQELTFGKAFRLGSFNILGSNHVAKGSSIGQCGGSPPGCVELRARRAVEAIQGNTEGPLGSATESPPLEIVGVQEMQRDQFRLFKQLLKGYSSFPATGTAAGVAESLFWSSRFTLLKSGYIRIPWYGNDGLTPGHRVPWVLLKDSLSGSRLFVLNHHPVAWNKNPGSDKGGAEKREAAARIVRQWVEARRQAQPNIPVFVTGDFNSRFVIRPTNDAAYHGDRSRLPYCILTKQGLLTHVVDVLNNRTGCPIRQNSAGGFTIDHIYIAGTAQVKTVRAGRYGRDANSPTLTMSSDHAAVFADVRLVKVTAPAPTPTPTPNPTPTPTPTPDAGTPVPETPDAGTGASENPLEQPPVEEELPPIDGEVAPGEEVPADDEDPAASVDPDFDEDVGDTEEDVEVVGEGATDEQGSEEQPMFITATGCSASGGSLLPLFALAGLLARRRRRARA